MTGLREVVESQPLEVAPYGLLSLRDPTVTGDERWLAGMATDSLSCTAEVNILDICNGADPINVIERASGYDPVRDYQPFVLEAVEKCSTFGFEARDVEARAVAALEACTQKGLEYEFWTGEAAQANGYTDNRYLASSDSEDVTPSAGTAVKVRYGLALLERALADCGCGTRGVIHVTHDVASVLAVRQQGSHLETQLGNYVVAGSGYTGSGPDGSMPSGGVFMYATGPVSVRLGRSEAVGAKLKQQVDTSVNTWEARATRAAAVTWDGCCAFAVQVDLALDYQ